MIWSAIMEFCGLVKKDKTVIEETPPAATYPVVKGTNQELPEFIDNDNVVLSVYRDESGSLYVGVHDRDDESKRIVLTAEAVYKVAYIVDGVFESKKNASANNTLN